MDKNSANGMGKQKICSLFFVILAIFCVSLSTVTFFKAIHKPFTLDETDIIHRAYLIRTEGPWGPSMIADNKIGEAIPHPPLCEYVFALIFNVFGESELTGRGFGLLCYLLIGSFIAIALWRMLDGQSLFLRRAAVFLFSILCLVNPLLIQHGLLVDSDTTVSALFCALFVSFFSISESWTGNKFFRSRFYLAVIFALAYLSKEGTPSILAAALFVFRSLNRDWKKLFTDILFVVVLGTALAWGIWALFCSIYKIDVMVFFKHQYAMRASRISNLDFFKRVISNLPEISRWPIYWVSAPFFIGLIVSLGFRVREFFRQKRLSLIDHWTITALFIWLPFLLLKPSIDMMKYQYLTYFLFTALIAYTFFDLFRSHETAVKQFLFSRPLFVFGIISLGIALGVYYYFRGDYILFLFDNAEISQRWKDFLPAYYRPLGLILGGVVLLSLARKYDLRRSVFVASIFLILPINAALDIRQAQASYTTVESWLNYGESGFRDTVKTLSRLPLSKLYTCIRKDMVYYLKHDHGVVSKNNFDPIYIFRPTEALYFLGLPERERPDLIVLDKVCLMSSPPSPMGQELLKNYRVFKKEGDFTILISQYLPEKIK